MTQGRKEGEPNGRDIYPDIIDHPHWQSPTRPQMSLYDRAAQFSAFDALAGYSDMVKEEQRWTDSQIELPEAEIESLNQKLRLITEAIAEGQHPTVTIRYFVPDKRKIGGKYVEIRDAVKSIDSTGQKVVLMSREGKGQINRAVAFERIVGIS